MGKRVAILQSNYIPWKGYFDIINDVDTFVLLEDVQYTKNDWRNRNRIKGANGLLWLTVPILTQNRFGQKIFEAEIKESTNWQEKHWKSITGSYSKTPFFQEYKQHFEPIYMDSKWKYLSELNITLIRKISKLLNIKTEFVLSTDLDLELDEDDPAVRTNRVLMLCQHLSADHYLSGPAARSYIDEAKFKNAGIELSYKDYSHYPEYPQRFGDFEGSVSILDTLFCCGEEAPKYIWDVA